MLRARNKKKIVLSVRNKKNRAQIEKAPLGKKDMEIIYLALAATILLLTLPLSSLKVVYSHDESQQRYDALARWKKGQRQPVYIGAGLIAIGLIAMCIFRSDELADYQMYENLYRMGGGENLRQDIEASFVTIVKLSPTFLILLGIYATLSVGSHIMGIFKNSPNIWLSLVVYLSYYFVLHDMIQMRVAIGLGIILYAVRYITERKILPYMLLVGIAFWFHKSMALFLPLYFIPYKNLNKWVWSGIILMALVMGYTNNAFGYVAKFIPVDFIDAYVRSYMGNRDYVASKLGIQSALMAFVAIFLLFNLKEIKRHYPLAVPVLMFYIISQLCYLLFVDIPVMRARLGELFGTFDIFAFAMLPLASKKYYYPLMIVSILLCLLRVPITIELLAGTAM